MQLTREDIAKIARLQAEARQRHNGPGQAVRNGRVTVYRPASAASAAPPSRLRQQIASGNIRHFDALLPLAHPLRLRRRRLTQAHAAASRLNRRRVGWLAGGFFGTVLLILLLVVGGSVSIAAGLFFYWTRDLPVVDDLAARANTFQTTEILDRNGVLLYKLWDEGKRTYKHLDEIAPAVVSATLAIEDPSFYANQGVDTRGILRAIYINLSGKGRSGGSTITQQLVRRVLLPEGDEQTIARKVREATLAVRLTEKYSKNEILELYLNQIYYGNLSYGIEAASQTYYNRPADALTLGQATMLAGLPQLPNDYDPLLHFDLAKQRQRLVLENMVKYGFITTAQANAAAREDVTPHVQGDDANVLAPHFVNYVRAELVAKYGAARVNRGGLRVTTTLDLNYQQLGQRIVTDQVQKLASQNAHNAALVAIKPETGEILAMVGSVDYRQPDFGQFNVTVAPRQPGSSFKPIVYALGLSKGLMTPATQFADLITAFPSGGNVYIPANYDDREHGPVLLRTALAGSLNIPAVKAQQQVGLPDTLALARIMGITSLGTDSGKYGLALSLGGGEVTLLEMTGAYATFANQGAYIPPTSILEVRDSNGAVIEKYDPANPAKRQVVSPAVSYLISDILSDNDARSFVFGQENALKLSRPAAAKTGTTNDYRDNWTLGYTPYLAVGVWLGNNDNAPLDKVAGARGAGPIWHDFMEAVFGNAPLQATLQDPSGRAMQLTFPRPPEVVTAPICKIDGLKPSPACTAANQVRDELFVKGTEPQQSDTIYHFVRVCDLPDRAPCIANPYCPLLLQVDKPFPTLPDEYQTWAATTDIVQAPTEICDAPGPPKPDATTLPNVVPNQPNLPPNPVADADFPNLALSIDAPAGEAVRGLIQIRGTARSDNFDHYALEYSANGTLWLPTSGTQYRTPVSSSFLDSWNTDRVAEGSYQLRLTLYTQAGKSRSAYSSVRIERSTPTARIAYPTDGTHLLPNQRVTIQTTVGGTNIVQVELYVDDVPVAYTSRYPYQFDWPVLAGPHTLSIIVRTASGQSVKSDVVHIDATPKLYVTPAAGQPTRNPAAPTTSMSPAAPTSPPIVIRFVQPSDGATLYTARMPLQVEASNPLITRIVFSVDGKGIGEGAPSTNVYWATTPGKHTLTATAYDAQGAQIGDPIAIQVTVQ